MRKVGPRTVPQFRQCLQSAWREISLYIRLKIYLTEFPKYTMQLKQKGDFLLKKNYKIFEQSVTDIFIILYTVKRDQIIASKLCQNKKLCKNVCFIVFVQELVNRSVPYSNIFALSLPLLFLTLLRRRGVSPPFLISCASSLRFSVVFMLLRAQSAPPPSLPLLLKDSPFASVLHLSILSFPLQLRPPLLPISLSHFCVAFRVFLRLFLLSHFLGPSFPYRRLALSSTPFSVRLRVF